MKSLAVISTLTLFCAFNVSGQKKLTIKTSDGSGMDAYAWNENDSNYGAEPFIRVMAENTKRLVLISRAYFYFDLDELPTNAKIKGATFTLYSDPADQRTQETTDPDSIIVNPITENWNDTTLTWANAPIVDSSMRTAIMQNTIKYPVYKFDLTDIVKFWLENPGHNKGMRVALKNEMPFTIFYCASNDNPNKDIHPSLEISYDTPGSIEDQDGNNQLLLSTSGNGNFNLRTSDDDLINSYAIIGMNGQVIQTENVKSKQLGFSLSHLSPGMYIIEVRTLNNTMRKLLLNN